MAERLNAPEYIPVHHWGYKFPGVSRVRILPPRLRFYADSSERSDSPRVTFVLDPGDGGRHTAAPNA